MSILFNSNKSNLQSSWHHFGKNRKSVWKLVTDFCRWLKLSYWWPWVKLLPLICVAILVCHIKCSVFFLHFEFRLNLVQMQKICFDQKKAHKLLTIRTFDLIHQNSFLFTNFNFYSHHFSHKIHTQIKICVFVHNAKENVLVSMGLKIVIHLTPLFWKSTQCNKKHADLRSKVIEFIKFRLN